MPYRTTLAAAPRTKDERLAAAEEIVTDLLSKLTEAALSGVLTNALGWGITERILGPNAVLPQAIVLIEYTRAHHAAQAARRDNPVQDCANPMGQPHLPSCTETVLTQLRYQAATELAELLVTGHWPVA